MVLPLQATTPYGATTSSQGTPGSDHNNGVLHVPQSSTISEASSSDGLVSCPGDSLGESYPSAERQSEYSTTPADMALRLSYVFSWINGISIFVRYLIANPFVRILVQT